MSKLNLYTKLLNELNVLLDRDKVKNMPNTLKKMHNSAITLTKTNYRNIYPPTGWLLTEKADGIRCFLYIGKTSYVISDTVDTINIKKDNITILDCELINKNIILIFDVLYFDGINVTKENMSDRLNYLTTKNFTDTIKYKIYVKQYFELNSKNIEKTVHTILKKKYQYSIDGLILVNPKSSYYKTKTFKVKTSENNTIDFLLIKVPKFLLGKDGIVSKKNKTLYFLFNGISLPVQRKIGIKKIKNYSLLTKHLKYNKFYFPIQFSPSQKPNAYFFYSERDNLNNKIVELLYNKETDNWNFVKIREDRKVSKNYFGNDFKTAELNFQNYFNPFNYKELWDPDFGYFSNKTDPMYNSMKKYNRFVVKKILKTFIQKKSNLLIDLAGGRGADVPTYKELEIKNVLIVDSDPNAISELIIRKFEVKDDVKINHTNIYTQTQNLITTQNTDIVKMMKNNFNIDKNDANYIVCNFAIHYFCESENTIKKFVELCSYLLNNKNSRIIFTTMSGKSINQLFVKDGRIRTWKLIENNKEKYKIKKMYNGKVLLNAGQNIQVKLPFSGDRTITEPLANIDYIIKLFEEKNFKLIERNSFNKFFTATKITDKLNTNDKFYISLFEYVVMEK